MRRTLIVAAALLFSAAPAQERTIADNRDVPPERSAEERPFAGSPTPSFPTGLTFRGTVKSDLLTSANGGLQRGVRTITQADLFAELDGDELAGLTGARMAVQFMANSGGGLNAFTGELQVASNIEAYRTMRLYQCWVQQELPDLGLSLLAGLFDLNSEFYVTESSGLFLNSSFGIGADLAQTGRNGPSIFPSTSLAFRVRFELPETGSLSAAVFDGAPGAHDDGERFGIDVDGEEGYLLITELSIAAGDGGRIGGGLWRYTAPFDDMCAVDEPVARQDNNGAYLLADLSLVPGAADDDVLHLFLRAGAANGHLNAVMRHLGTGFVYELGGGDLLDGYALAVAEVGGDYLFLQSADGIPTASAESVHELTMSRRITDWLTVQGDAQYIVRPSARRDIGHAFVGIARFIVTIE